MTRRVLLATACLALTSCQAPTTLRGLESFPCGLSASVKPDVLTGLTKPPPEVYAKVTCRLATLSSTPAKRA